MNEFDKYIERKESASIKYDGLSRYFNVKDAKPLWVADMDFATPDFVLQDLNKRVEHPILGYEELGDDFYNSIIQWYKKRHNLHLEKEEIVHVPGVVAGLSMAVDAFSEEGDEIIVQSPVYYPFFSVVKDQDRKLVLNPLKKDGLEYTMDLEDLKQKITEKTKMIILCSPHNPVGRVWSKKELKELAQICIENNILIISDEIHSDLVFKEFTPMSDISEEISMNTLTFNAPSKTFNLAGLNTSFIFSKNKEILKKFNKMLKRRALGLPNIFGIKSLISSYNKGEEWLEDLLKYLDNNFNLVLEELKETKIITKKPEATYLMWLDFSNYNLSQKEIETKLLKEAKVALNNGLTFGKEGKGFFRLNIALPKDELQKALNSLKSVFK